MMLSDHEQNFLIDFLNVMDDNKLKSLASSVTQGRLHSNTREDAVKCVLLHSESLISFFNKKKITTSILLYFLHQMNVAVPGNASKETLIKHIFELWNLESPSICSIPLQQTQGYQNLLIPKETSKQDLISQMITSNELLKQFNSLAFDDYIMEFATQFYSLLNSTSHGEYMHGFDKSHFFEDCKIIIRMIGNGETIEEVGNSIKNVLEILSNIKKKYDLYFNPNLSADGVRGKRECHGLILAVASGTLHRPEGIVGVFEQSFILRIDPFERNICKIVEATLNLTSSKSVDSYAQLMQSNKKQANLAIEKSFNGDHNLQIQN